MKATVLSVAAALALVSCRQEELTLLSKPREIYQLSPSPSQDPGQLRAGTVYLVSEDRLVAERRNLSVAPTVPEALLQTLLEEPERSAIPPDTRILSVGVVGDVATVDLSEEFEQGASGSDLALRVAQVVYTLTEGPPIKKVLFAIEGTQRPVIAGNLRDVLGVPVTRQDYARFAPRA